MAFSNFFHRTAFTTTFLGFYILFTKSIFAQTVEEAWEWYKPVTDIAEHISWFHDMLFILIVAITLFVLGLLLWVIIRYNEKANPVPTKTSHNTAIEITWTLVPCVILVVVFYFSLVLLKDQYKIPKADVVVKAIGYQWYWGYEYPGKEIQFEGRMLRGEDLDKARSKGNPAPRLLSVDNPMVVPVNKVTYVYVSSEDVIHNWTVPAFGAKMDAIPGSPRLIWFKPKETGIFYGQCSELCGTDHAFMPIEVRVVSDETYKQWQDAIKQDEEKANEILQQAYLEDTERKTKQFAGNTATSQSETVE